MEAEYIYYDGQRGIGMGIKMAKEFIEEWFGYDMDGLRRLLP